jgi:hypothetical protein
MKRANIICGALGLLVITSCLFTLSPSTAYANGKVGIYGIRMVPDGEDATNYSRAGWGLGFHTVVPVPQVWNLFAATGGFEWINLLDETTEFRDRITGLRVEQRTNQNYIRLFLGGQVGGHGNGFIRPHAGMNLALVIYEISAENVIPDDNNPENDTHQKLYDNTKAVVGYDFTLGVDLNFSNSVVFEGGVRYLKSLALPQELGGKSVTVYPRYFQAYIGVGIDFSVFKKLDEK